MIFQFFRVYIQNLSSHLAKYPKYFSNFSSTVASLRGGTLDVEDRRWHLSSARVSLSDELETVVRERLFRRVGLGGEEMTMRCQREAYSSRDIGGIPYLRNLAGLYIALADDNTLDLVHWEGTGSPQGLTGLHVGACHSLADVVSTVGVFEKHPTFKTK